MAEFISDTRSALSIDLQRQMQGKEQKLPCRFSRLHQARHRKYCRHGRYICVKKKLTDPGKDMEGNVVAAFFRAYGDIALFAP